MANRSVARHDSSPAIVTRIMQGVGGLAGNRFSSPLLFDFLGCGDMPPLSDEILEVLGQRKAEVEERFQLDLQAPEADFVAED